MNSDHFSRLGGLGKILHNGLGFIRPVKVRARPIQFNSGPTPRDAVLDFVRLVEEYPEAWDRI